MLDLFKPLVTVHLTSETRTQHTTHAHKLKHARTHTHADRYINTHEPMNTCTRKQRYRNERKPTYPFINTRTRPHARTHIHTLTKNACTFSKSELQYPLALESFCDSSESLWLGSLTCCNTSILSIANSDVFIWYKSITNSAVVISLPD